MPNFACSHCTTPPLCSSVLYLCPIAIWNSSFEYLCRTFFTACRRLNCFWFRFVFCCRSSSCGFSVSSSVTSPELSSCVVPEPITGGGGGGGGGFKGVVDTVVEVFSSVGLTSRTSVLERNGLNLSEWIILGLPPLAFRIM